MTGAIRIFAVCAALISTQTLGCASRPLGTGMLVGGAALAVGGGVATGVGLSCRKSADLNDETAESCAGNPVTYTGLAMLGAGVFVGGIGLSVLEMSKPPAKTPK
ncbi:MAG: hypothetical protein WKG00_33925 [Polyangiaceae bacterium]